MLGSAVTSKAEHGRFARIRKSRRVSIRDLALPAVVLNDSEPTSRRGARSGEKATAGDACRPCRRRLAVATSGRTGSPLLLRMETPVSRDRFSSVVPGRSLARTYLSGSRFATSVGSRRSDGSPLRCESRASRDVAGPGAPSKPNEVQTAITTAHGRQGERCLPARSRGGSGGVVQVSITWRRAAGC